jgi:magnesium transporter
MEPSYTPRRAELLGASLRRFTRRGARGHISKLLAKTRPEDVAIQLRGLTPSEQHSVFKVLLQDHPQSAGEVLTELEPDLRLAIVGSLDAQAIAGLLEQMPVDDAVALVEVLPHDLQEQVLAIVDVRDLEDVQEHLTYEDETAGRIMDSDFVALPESTLVGDAVSTMHELAAETENLLYLYVVDADQHLLGVTSLRQLLLSPPSRTLGEIITRSMIKVDTDTDQEEVAQLAARYDLLAIPVTDDHNRLVGIVTVDDIIDVFKEEATEDFFKMVGTSDDELVYQDRSFKVAGFRLPWLLINLIGLGLAGVLVERFQVNLREALFLLVFVPVVMGMGGNLGSQTSTIAVRGLATGRIGAGQRRQFLWQQVKVGAILGVACAALAAGGAVLLESVWDLSGSEMSISLVHYAGVVGVSLFLAILLASLNGALVPLVFERLGIDPAVAAGPLVTTTMDITGIVIYFGLASILIDSLIR